MDASLRTKILELLDQHRPMSVATNRPDGWPQATTVGYANDVLPLCPESQKAQNLARDDRISLTIDHDTSDPMTITGLSMAAHAETVDNPAEVATPSPEEIRFFRVTPTVISVLDYAKGFGYSDLVVV
jgi:hypothetical protein